MYVNKLAKEIDNLVDNFIVKTQAMSAGPMAGYEYGQSVKEILLEKFENAITADAMTIVQKISDDIWNKTEKSFGYFEIDLKLAIKNGNVVLAFVISPTLRSNQDNNQILARQLNARLPGKYNHLMTRVVKSLKDVPKELFFDFFQLSGSV